MHTRNSLRRRKQNAKGPQEELRATFTFFASSFFFFFGLTAGSQAVMEIAGWVGLRVAI
jgi:hypothetical protein